MVKPPSIVESHRSAQSEADPTRQFTARPLDRCWDPGEAGEGGCWIAAWHDHDGKRCERTTGTTDKAAAERILRKRVTDAALRLEGVIPPRAEAISRQAERPIDEQRSEWEVALKAKGSGAKRIWMAL